MARAKAVKVETKPLSSERIEIAATGIDRASAAVASIMPGR